MGLVAAWGFPALDDVTRVARDPERLAVASAVLEPARRQRRVLSRVAELAAAAVGAQVGYVTLVVAEGTHVIGSTASTVPAVVPLELSACSHVIAAGGPIAVGDLSRDAVGRGLAPTRDGMLAFAAAPILVDEHPVGSVAVADPAVRLFRPDELELLDDLAAAAGHQLARFAAAAHG